MEYKFAAKQNYGDLSSGKVIYGKSGNTNFPVRLGNEIFLRAVSYLKDTSNLSVYNPCCGSGYLLTTLGFLNGNIIKEIIGSDIDLDSIEIARKNINLLTSDGLNKRLNELIQLYDSYDKESHKEAILSVKKLISERKFGEIKFNIFERNILAIEPEPLLTADIIITDIPYGNMKTWENGDGGVEDLIKNLRKNASNNTVLAIIAGNHIKIKSPNIRILEKNKIGKRCFYIFKYID